MTRDLPIKFSGHTHAANGIAVVAVHSLMRYF